MNYNEIYIPDIGWEDVTGILLLYIGLFSFFSFIAWRLFNED